MPDTSIFNRRAYARAILPPLQAEPLPGWCYASPKFHKREIDRVFFRSWICLGRENALPNPGDYRTVELCGARLIVIRDHGGTIRVLNNVCRHRGMVLLEGSGNVPGIRCPFHGWAYALDGSLRGAPSMDKSENFDRRDYGLISYEVALWQGFIFARLEPGGPAFEALVGDLDRLLAPYDLAALRLAKTKRFTVECNWKLFIEVFMEDYHVNPVHKATIAGTYASHAPQMATGANGAHATIWDKHEGTSALLTAEQKLALPMIEGLPETAFGTRYVWIYPSFAFAATIDCMWGFEIYPDGPSRTHVAMNLCFPEETMARPDFAEKFARYEKRWEVSMNEDIVVLEGQQRGMNTGRYLPGRLSHLEPCLNSFANWLVARIAD
jgi:phenylpropionate dioxygenase-like ring-hydroxylating dioxygenase large terminal subunit